MGDSLAGLPEGLTARLRLTALTGRDAEELRVLTDDPAITANVNFLPTPFTPDDSRALIRTNDGDRDRFLALRSRRTATLIGVAGTHLRGDDGIEVGYWIGRPHHGQGYATEALRGVIALLEAAFPDRRIFAECRPENAASWRVLGKAGFVATGLDGERPGRRRLILAPERNGGNTDGIR